MAGENDFDIGPDTERPRMLGELAHLCPVCGSVPPLPRRTNPTSINTRPEWAMACIVGCYRTTGRSKEQAFLAWNRRSVESAREVVARGR